MFLTAYKTSFDAPHPLCPQVCAEWFPSLVSLATIPLSHRYAPGLIVKCFTQRYIDLGIADTFIFNHTNFISTCRIGFVAALVVHAFYRLVSGAEHSFYEIFLETGYFYGCENHVS